MEEGTIPKIIHQMWLDKKVLDNEGPPESRSVYLSYMNKWKELHPEYTYMFWNRKRVDSLLEKYPRYKTFYENEIEAHIEKCDFARYVVLLEYGGIYVDLDVEPLKKITPLLKGRDKILIFESKDTRTHLVEPHRRLFNGWLGATPNDPFWSNWIDYLMSHYVRNFSVMWNTGPSAFANFIWEKYPSVAKESVDNTNVHTVNHCLVFPYTNRDGIYSECEGIELDPYTVIHWNDGTYWSQGTREAQRSLTWGTYTLTPLVILLVWIVAFIILMALVWVGKI